MLDRVELHAAYERIEELTKLLRWSLDVLTGPEVDYGDSAYRCADAIDEALDSRVAL